MGENDETPRYDQRIHALVSKRQKREWKELTEGDTAQYVSLSQLVRTAVQREIANENPIRGGNGEIPAELQKAILSMADTIDNIDSRLSSVQRRLSKLEVESDEDALDVQQRILQVLPTPPEGEETPIGERVTVEQSQIQKWAVRAPEVASQVNADEETVERALEQLNEMTGLVQCRIGGEPARKWYYRRD